jgi:hypothetical protein
MNQEYNQAPQPTQILDNVRGKSLWMSYLNSKAQKIQWSKGVRLEYTQIINLNITKEFFEFNIANQLFYHLD